MKADTLQHNVAILGPGLLGGSLALALGAISGEKSVTLWGRRQEAVDQAKSMGVACVTTHLKEALAEAEIVILSTPVGAMTSLVQQILSCVGSRKVLISDVGSVKRMPTEMILPLLKDSPHRFIGGHPMAGSEKQGMGAAQADLFHQALTVLTPSSDDSDSDVQALQDMWTLAGARTRIMDAASHDLAVARFSHYPHLMSSLCADVALDDSSECDVSGNGLRDTTRVASGDAAMWAEILMENRTAVGDLVEETITQLRDVLDTLRGSDHSQLQSFLQRAKDKRDALKPSSSHTPPSSHE